MKKTMDNNRIAAAFWGVFLAVALLLSGCAHPLMKTGEKEKAPAAEKVKKDEAEKEKKKPRKKKPEVRKEKPGKEPVRRKPEAAGEEEAVSLLDEAYAHYREGKYEKANEALGEYRKKEPENKRALKLRSIMDAKAEKHYKRGLSFYVKEKFELAAEEMRTTLALNPGHPRAARDLASIENIIEKLDGMRK